MKAIRFLLVLFSKIGFTQKDNPVQNNNSSDSINRSNDYPMHSIDLRESFWNNSQSAVSVGFYGVSVKTSTGVILGKIGSRKNYSGNEFSIGLGLML